LIRRGATTPRFVIGVNANKLCTFFNSFSHPSGTFSNLGKGRVESVDFAASSF
jgi:hypothetical protein